MPASDMPNTVTKETLFALTEGFSKDYTFLSTLLGLWIHSNMVRSYDFVCFVLFILYALKLEYDRAPYPLRLRASRLNGGVPHPLPFVPFTPGSWHWDSNP